MAFKQLPLCLAKFVSGHQTSLFKKKKVIKYDICNNVYEHFDLPTMGENIYRSMGAAKRPQIGKDLRGRGRYVISDGRMWTENRKGGERMCKVECY